MALHEGRFSGPIVNPLAESTVRIFCTDLTCPMSEPCPALLTWLERLSLKANNLETSSIIHLCLMMISMTKIEQRLLPPVWIMTPRMT